MVKENSLMIVSSVLFLPTQSQVMFNEMRSMNSKFSRLFSIEKHHNHDVHYHQFLQLLLQRSMHAWIRERWACVHLGWQMAEHNEVLSVYLLFIFTLFLL